MAAPSIAPIANVGTVFMASIPRLYRKSAPGRDAPNDRPDHRHIMGDWQKKRTSRLDKPERTKSAAEVAGRKVDANRVGFSESQCGSLLQDSRLLLDVTEASLLLASPEKPEAEAVVDFDDVEVAAIKQTEDALGEVAGFIRSAVRRRLP